MPTEQITLTLTLKRDEKGRPSVYALSSPPWADVDVSIDDVINGGMDPRVAAGDAAGQLLGYGQYIRPVDHEPNVHGELIFR